MLGRERIPIGGVPLWVRLAPGKTYIGYDPASGEDIGVEVTLKKVMGRAYVVGFRKLPRNIAGHGE